MILACSGWACTRLISVSKVPGGNPVARNDPEGFAIEFMICGDCGKNFCDRCHAPGSVFRAPRCAHCGGKLVPGRRLEQLSGRPRPAEVEHHDRAVSAIGSGRFEDALRDLDEAIRLRPAYATAHHWRGIALTDSGRPAEALAAFEEAIRLNPSDVPSRFEKARALSLLERDAEALAAYEETVAVEPRYPAPQVNRAVLLMDAGRDAEALAAIDQAIALLTSGTAVGAGQYDLASAHSVKGAALVKLDRCEEALPVIDYAIDNGPDSWNDHYNKSVALEALGRIEESEIARNIADSLRDA
ncbi:MULTISPECIES: tetratricopeptide repeat protein [Actinomadura]|jgi:tetratricopeptide (TPR) repeat protein|uniref:tetratricopeptide repeat protein n=1 Tax=Actinomadura TaxID=1988 RepID=UPI002639F43B|nr:tetratricopeptide repeat protein [Actinomadura geliboluensis]